MSEQTVPKKSKKKKLIAASIILGALAMLDYSQFHYVLGKCEKSADSTSVVTMDATVIATDTTK